MTALKISKFKKQNPIDQYLTNGSWRIKENANHIFCVGHMMNYTSAVAIKDYWMKHIVNSKARRFHNEGRIHIHDLSRMTPYCVGFSTSEVIKKGLPGPQGRITSSPPNHLSSTINQLTNFVGVISQEFAGAIALNDFAVYLAPFVYYDKLSYKEVKQEIQQFIFHMNQPNRWAGECVDDETEILTESGWKSYNEVEVGTPIYTFNDGKLEINPIKGMTIRPHDDSMYRIIGQNQNQLITPGHRVLYNQNGQYLYKTAEELYKENTSIIIPRAGIIEKSKAEITDNEIKLLAMIFADGYIGKKDTDRIQIFKSAEHKSDNLLIKKILENNSLNYDIQTRVRKNRFNIKSKDNTYRISYPDTRKLKHMYELNKKLPNFLLHFNKEQADLFIKTYMLFDGSISKNAILIDNNFEHNINMFQHLGMIAGYSSKISIRGSSTYVKFLYGNNQHNCKIQKESYKGTVWCPNVKNETWVARKDGNIFITKNCPFTNITLNLTVPKDLKDNKAIVGGKEMDKTYSEFEKEIHMITEAILEVLIEGDASGTPMTFPVLTIGINEDFPWESEIAKKIFQVTAKYGTPFFENFKPSTGRDPSDSRSMCCRLRIDTKEVKKHTGGIFGNADSMGSLAVVTVNLNRIGFEANNKSEYYSYIDDAMEVAKEILNARRLQINKMFKMGLYPYTQMYLKNYENFFSTIGVIGGNESMMNFMEKDLMDSEALTFMNEVLAYMDKKTKSFQKETGDLFNFEAVPGEGAMYSLALKDREAYGNKIYLSGKDEPFLSNSTLPPVEETNFLKVIKSQEDLQVKYSGGTTLNIYLGEKLANYKQARSLVKSIIDNTIIPYFSITPVYSLCKEHGYIAGENFKCPQCDSPCEVFSRVVGYLKPRQQYNKGKAEEFKNRKYYDVSDIEQLSESENESKDKTIE